MRRYYLDNIRWVTVVLVAIYHVFFIFSGIIPGMGIPFKEVQYQDAVLYILYPWFMILLFIVAGISSRLYLKKHTTKEFIISRTVKLLVPSTIGLLFYGWIQGYISISIADSYEAIRTGVPMPLRFFVITLSGTGILWFVQMLWLFSMLLAFIRRYEKGRLYALTGKMNLIAVILLGIPMWLSGLVLNMPVITVFRFGIYTFAFFMGYFVFAHDEIIVKISHWKYVFIIAAVILGAVYVWLHFGDNYADMPVMGSIPAMSYAWAVILAAFGMAKSWGDGTGPVRSFMSKRSWGLYIFHYLVMSATAFSLRMHTSLTEVPCYLITGAAMFIGSLILYEVISRIPVLRWCILGIRK